MPLKKCCNTCCHFRYRVCDLELFKPVRLRNEIFQYEDNEEIAKEISEDIAPKHPEDFFCCYYE